ncbi:phage tail protein [Lentzea sp. BCCO 10_0856]|uniref:Phage tail protein n=1 Tax=Lentzea miocenica TaxID=3095431 RepID=A0ABU4SZP2_9PSEU|nr:phage tail protein [Lentzea sp. BCCO 10_0856]MDX8031385.1 phage tail protein [Lentzea sp. BCCO 10_0856]
MATRDHPYGAFNFRVEIDPSPEGGGDPIVAGFSDVSGLGNEMNYSDYREGVDPRNAVRKIPNTNKTDEVTFKRGIIGSTDIFDWFAQVRDGEYAPRRITVTLLDEARTQVVSVELMRAQPKKWTGPTLAAKGGGEVAMEELKVVCEWIEYTSL